MRCRTSGILTILALTLTVPSFAASRSGGFSGGGGFRSSSPSFRSSTPSPSFRMSTPSTPAPAPRVSMPSPAPSMPVVSTPTPRPTPVTPVPSMGTRTVTTPVPTTQPRGSMVPSAVPGVAATVTPNRSVGPQTTAIQAQPRPRGSMVPSTTPGMATTATPRGSFRPSTTANAPTGPAFRRSLPVASRVPSAYATRTPVSTRTYMYGGSPVVANYYGGWSGYSYAWGSPAWYYNAPLHPAFFMNPPVVVNGQMYPGGFNFGRFFFGLIIWAAVIYLIWRFVFANRGPVRTS